MKAARNRRIFLQRSGLAAGALVAAQGPFVLAQPKRTYKAAVIGRTGAGDYGHHYDTVFNGFDNITVTAVADENFTDIQRIQQRTGAERVYKDYREMLEKEKPNLVCIAMRQPGCHRDMALAAIEIGAHLFMEKPMTETPQEADEILAAADAKGIKIAVAHNKRYQDDFLHMQKLIEDGYLGDILEVRFQGKQDSRYGGEDLYVLGTHDLDMMRMWFGDPQWCFASVTQDGRDIAKRDIRKGSEPYTVAGDCIHAEYRFENNVQCSWSSVKADGWNENLKIGEITTNKWGFDIFGTKRIMTHLEGIGTYILDAPFLAHGKWTRLEEVGVYKKPERLSHMIADLLYAIEHDVQPHCSGYDGRWAVEMACAVYRSQQAKARVTFPLEERGQPLLDI